MTILTIALLSTQAITLCLGLLVYLTNSKRLANKQFLILSIHLTMWAFCVLRIIDSNDELTAGFWIRAAFAVTAFFPGSFTLLLSAISRSTSSWPALYAKHFPFLLLNLIAALLSLTPFFMREVVISEPNTAGFYCVPEPVYGVGYYIYVVYFIATCIVAGSIFYRAFRKSTGIQHYELQFILYGFGASFLVGVSSALLLPLLLEGSQTSQFGPLGVILLDAIVAYGITTRKILGIITILQRLTARVLLVAYLSLVYYCVWAVTRYIFPTLAETFPTIPSLLSTIAVVVSMAPLRGRVQRVANKLISSNTMNVPVTMKKAGDIFQSVTTIDALLQQFSDLLMAALIADDMRIFLAEGSDYIQQYPIQTPDTTALLPKASAIAEVVQKTKDPVCGDTLVRIRQTSKIQDVIHELNELNARVVAGVFAKTGLCGLVVFGSRHGGRIYDRNEQDALQILCNQFAVALENAQMYTEMQDSKIRNDIMLDQLVSGVIVADPDHKIALINHEAQRITGLTEEQCLGQGIGLLPECIFETLESTLTTQKGVHNITAALLAEKEEKSTHVRMGSTYLLGHDEKPMGALLVFTDMTEVKGLEEQVRRSDQLSSVGTLAAGMAHEIKNPLVTIKTFTQLLPKRHGDADFRHEFSSLVAHEVSRIDGIVNQLLSFSKPRKPHLVPMKLHDIVEKTLKLIHEQLSQKNIALNKNLQTRHNLISGDADLLTQALVNFNLNAIEAIGSDGTINVASSNCTYRFAQGDNPDNAVDKSCIQLQISDTGKGIAQDQLQKIFDPFFTSKSEGTGMGLSVAHGIIQEHHGAIEVESRSGKGTTFSIYIPILEKGDPA